MHSSLVALAVDSFLREDLGFGDITTESIFTGREMATARLVAKQPCIAAGAGSVAALVFARINPATGIHAAIADGASVSAGEVLLEVAGPTADLLQAERVALNLLQRLCGIATLTRAFVEKISGSRAKIVDTRKTTPGLRHLEKYAVRVGGGNNHRFSLADGILIKDNHIAACGSIARAVERVRKRAPHTLRIEVEAATLSQVRECLDSRVDVIMLDNMPPALMREAVALIGGRALVEASGNVTLATVAEVAATGVDLISVGALTHSAPACDISMRLLSSP
ncbi:MAG: carboxylating nicotinate-nucleotide diphosphorylase [Thermodesulfobacteriota bacterium]